MPRALGRPFSRTCVPPTGSSRGSIQFPRGSVGPRACPGPQRPRHRCPSPSPGAGILTSGGLRAPARPAEAGSAEALPPAARPGLGRARGAGAAFQGALGPGCVPWSVTALRTSELLAGYLPLQPSWCPAVEGGTFSCCWCQQQKGRTKDPPPKLGPELPAPALEFVRPRP